MEHLYISDSMFLYYALNLFNLLKSCFESNLEKQQQNLMAMDTRLWKSCYKAAQSKKYFLDFIITVAFYISRIIHKAHIFSMNHWELCCLWKKTVCSLKQTHHSLSTTIPISICFISGWLSSGNSSFVRSQTLGRPLCIEAK